MKTFMLCLFVSVVAFAKAQNIYIPDMTFKSMLVSDTAINTNHDNEIQVSEAANITRLVIRGGYIWASDMTYVGPFDLTGIESFPNLGYLYIDYDVKVSSLNLSGLANLQTVSHGSTFLNNINLHGCTGLDSITLSGYNNDQFSTVYNYSMDTLDVSDCRNLKYLSCSGYLGLDTIVGIENCTQLHTLGFVYVGADLKNIRNLVNLEQLIYQYGRNINLNLKNFTHLQKVSMYDIGVIDSFNVSDCINLEEFTCSYAPGTGVDSMDFSQCPRLRSLEIGGTDVHYLNLKNGSSIPPGALGIYGMPNLTRVCADESEVAQVFEQLTIGGISNSLVSTYCSFSPGGHYNTISGNIRADINNNGCDSSDRGLQNVIVKLADNTGQKYLTSSDIAGHYSLYTDKGNFTLAPFLPYPYFNAVPLSNSISFDTANYLTNISNFCLQPNGTHNDLAISFLPSFPRGRPGFNSGYIVSYKNRGTTVLSGNITVNFENNRMNFVSASENPASQATGQLVWNYNNLQPFESRTIEVIFNLLPPPVNNLNDTVTYLAAITPSVNDETPFDNSFILPQRLVGSYDPNDKQCLEGSNLDISKIGDYLHYQVRFQNEGTDTAFNIVVADTLSDNLDWNTFEFIGSSHATDVKLTNNKLEFFFPNINLPYKAINEPGSNGWVAFKIKPKPSVVIGDSINNTAAIYFDFNMPVITNKAITIVTSSSMPVPVKLEYFSVNKKNSTNLLNWKAACAYDNATFVIERSSDGIHFSSIGNINATSLRCQLPFNFIDNSPVAGKNYYRLKITDATGAGFYSKTLEVGNNKAGLEITAVTNNIVYINSNKQQTVQLKVIAADGRDILNERKAVTANTNTVILPIKNTAAGIYTIIIYTGDGTSTSRRFIK